MSTSKASRLRRLGLVCVGALTASVVALAPPARAGEIDTVAGGYVGDGGPAMDAILGHVRDVVVDPDGNVYLSDLRGWVRKVDPSGVITTVAGGPSRGYSGDGGPATEARLRSPGGLALDRDGNLYIADETGHRVRKVAPDGTISTVAGTGVPGSAGDGGPATAASLQQPSGLALDDAGNLYVADYSAHRVRMIDPSGTIRTVAGVGVSGFSGDGGPADLARLARPLDVAVDDDGNLYIADTGNVRVRKVSRETGAIETFAGSGEWGFGCDGRRSALSACFGQIAGLAFGNDGSLYIADAFNSTISRLGTDGMVRRFAGDGRPWVAGDGLPRLQASFDSPWGLDYAHGRLHVADFGGRKLRFVDGGIVDTLAGSGKWFCCDGSLATQAVLRRPEDVAVDREGNLYVADSYNHRIRVIRPSGIIETLAGTGKPGYSGDGGPAADARLRQPMGLAVDRAGNVYVSDSMNSRVRVVDRRGVIRTVAGTGKTAYSGDGGPATKAALSYPMGLAFDRDGNLYVADAENDRIRKVSRSGIITTVAGRGTQGFSGDGGPARSARLSYPVDVEVVHETMYVADASNARIRVVDASGTITTLAGTGHHGYSGDGGPATVANLYFPTGVEADRTGNVYVADRANHRIRMIDPTGTISTVAGSRYLQNHWTDTTDGGEGEGGYGGDGGPATAAHLCEPTAIVLAPGGGLYIADSCNDRVRFVQG